MARFKQSVVINQPVERVFAFVSDFENDRPWSGVAEVRQTSPGALGVGTTFQVRQRFLGRPLDVLLEVVHYERSRVITVKTISSRFLSMTGTRLVEPVGDATQLTFLGTGRVRGVLRPLEPLLAAAAGRYRLRTQLGRLKQYLEASALTDLLRDTAIRFPGVTASHYAGSLAAIAAAADAAARAHLHTLSCSRRGRGARWPARPARRAGTAADQPLWRRRGRRPVAGRGRHWRRG